MNDIRRSRFVVAIFSLLITQSVQAAAPSGPKDCGLRCLYITINALRPDTVSMEELSALSPRATEQGMTMAQMAEVAEHFGFEVEAFEMGIVEVSKLRRPFGCIAHIKPFHFVVVADVADDDLRRSVEYFDPPDVHRVSVEWFERISSRNYLVISEQPVTFERSWGTGFRYAAICALIGVIGVVTLSRRRRRR